MREDSDGTREGGKGRGVNGVLLMGQKRRRGEKGEGEGCFGMLRSIQKGRERRGGERCKWNLSDGTRVWKRMGRGEKGKGEGGGTFWR